MTLNQRVASVFDQAVEHVQLYGWRKGNSYNEVRDPQRRASDPHCAIQTLARAACSLAYSVRGEGPEVESAIQQLRVTIGHQSLVEWNDHPARTEQEVVQAFRDTAARIRAASS